MIKFLGGLGRFFLNLALLLLGLLTLGFFLFLLWVHVLGQTRQFTGGDVIVFTGYPDRIRTGVVLAEKNLEKREPARLRISGASRGFQRYLAPPRLDARVTLSIGFPVLSTVENVEDTLQWAIQEKLETVTIVSSDYHIPRIMWLIGKENLPFKLSFYGVPGRASSLRVFFKEYVKFLMTVAFGKKVNEHMEKLKRCGWWGPYDTLRKP